MKNLAQIFLILSFYAGYGFRGLAQVMPQDSLALVALYNSTDGANWFHNTNWLKTRVGLWEGVTAVANRVQTLSLVSNNMVGNIPKDFCDLSGLEYVYLQFNSLTDSIPHCLGNAKSIVAMNLSRNYLVGTFPSIRSSDIPNLTYMKITSNFFENFPDLTSFPKLSELYVDSNALSFDDIIPNCSIPNLTYLYTPQHANVPDLPEIYLKASEPFTLQISVGGIGNLYQWQSNFSNVSESNHCFGTQTYKIINTASEIGDGGFYSCLVTNPAAPLLTIQVESNRVEVADNRLSQTITFHNADTMYCGDTLQLNATSSSGLPVYYKLANGDSLTNRFAPQGNNSYVIVAYSDGDSIYQPASTTLNVHVLTHSPIPVFAIANDLPIYEGEELSLSVQDVPGVSYRWTLPNATYSFNDSIMIPSVTSSDQGWYTVSIYQGSCVFDTLRIDVELAVDTDLVIYELITPNGDGDNETFYIKNIEKTPPVQVTVFDVWHQVVYSKDNYQNDWNGGGLPVGTYYYLAKVDKWNKVYKGNLYIKR